MIDKIIAFIKEVIEMIPINENEQPTEDEEEKDEEKIDEKVAALNAMKAFLTIDYVWE
jgi:hypothetical protein